MIDRGPATPNPLVLIANDQEWSARSIESVLAPAGYDVVRAFTGRQALERARATQPDLVILDAQLPDLHGVEVCRMIQDDVRLKASSPIVIIVTSGPAGRNQRLEAYRAGAWEFLGQPIDGEALLLRLATFLRRKQEVDRQLEERLVDPATGLYNKRGLARRAREIGAAAFRRREPVACVVFAPEVEESGVNDEAEWEPIAEQLAQRFHQAGRASDAIGRLGKAEFAILAPGVPPAGVVRMAERLIQSIESLPVQVGDQSRTMRFRSGYCAVSDVAGSPVDAAELLSRATTALRALQQEGGKKRFRGFEELRPSL